MVEIVGKDTTSYFEATCSNCASILRFTKCETTTRLYRDITGCGERVIEIKCPCCGASVDVTSTILRTRR